MATLAEIRTECMALVREAEGISTSPYTDDYFARHINNAFDTLFERRFWDIHHREIDDVYQLGTNGLFYYDVSGVDTEKNLLSIYRDVRHIQYIFQEGYTYPIPRLQRNVNPAMANEVCWQPYNTGNALLRIRPFVTTGNFIIHGRYREITYYEENDEIPFDRMTLAYASVEKYFIDEAANIEAAKKYSALAEARLVQLENAEKPDVYSATIAQYPNVNSWW